MSLSLNSLNGVFYGTIIIGVVKGDTRSSGYDSHTATYEASIRCIHQASSCQTWMCGREPEGVVKAQGRELELLVRPREGRKIFIQLSASRIVQAGSQG